MSTPGFYIQYVSKAGTSYVKQIGKFFSFVSSKDQATLFKTQAEANSFVPLVKKLNKNPAAVTVISG